MKTFTEVIIILLWKIRIRTVQARDDVVLFLCPGVRWGLAMQTFNSRTL